MTDATQAPMRGLNVIDFRPLAKGSLIGFLTFAYGHITVHSAPVLQNGDRTWISLPGKPRLNRDGTPLLDARNKPLYEPICTWATRDGGDRVQAALLDQLAEKFPGALGGAE